MRIICLLLLSFINSVILRAVSDDAEFFYVGKLWLDESERLINAHGSGILFHDGVLYWLGEHK